MTRSIQGWRESWHLHCFSVIQTISLRRLRVPLFEGARQISYEILEISCLLYSTTAYPGFPKLIGTAHLSVSHTLQFGMKKKLATLFFTSHFDRERLWQRQYYYCPQVSILHLMADGPLSPAAGYSWHPHQTDEGADILLYRPLLHSLPGSYRRTMLRNGWQSLAILY